MKNAEIQMNLRDVLDKKVIHVLQHFNAEIKQTQHALAEMATMLDQMTNTLNSLVNVASNMRTAKQALDKHAGVRVESEGIPDDE